MGNIRNERDYKEKLARIELLMDAKEGSPEESELKHLVEIVEEYENKLYPLETDTPSTYIKYAMNEASIPQTELAKMLGISKARVSSIINGKSELTLELVRRVHDVLDIPIELLVEKHNCVQRQEPDYTQYPIAEIRKRKWVPEQFIKTIHEAKKYAKEIIQYLRDNSQVVEIFPRNTKSEVFNRYALEAWGMQVAIMAKDKTPSGLFDNTKIDDLVSELRECSIKENGPKLAVSILDRYGIAFVIEERLPKTYLDGAAFKSCKGFPVIAMTLRYDRIDYFWFTLFHELAHINLHLNDNHFHIDNELNRIDIEKENEADQWAQRQLIDNKDWEKIISGRELNSERVIGIASLLGISPAIIAGRLRKEGNNYKMYSQLVGNKKLRPLFDAK